jgi:hypothetical protein
MERATQAYRRGYNDCDCNRPKLFEDDGTFRGHDYNEGWWACWNEQYWNAQRDNKRINAKTENLP